jgi:uncharacterized protein (TIGR02145 family)
MVCSRILTVKARKNIVSAVLFLMVLSGCADDRKIGTAISIGDQVWMNRNLDVDRYRNGDPVREAQTVAEWQDAAAHEEGAWCRYEGEPENERVYGKLYNWFAVSDPRGLAPAGWHIPSDDEWKRLAVFLGGEGHAGGQLKNLNFRALSGIDADYSTGFSALPSGSRNCLDGFFGKERAAFFWTSTQSGDFEAWNRELGRASNAIHRVSVNKSLGLSVRCIKD